MRKGVMPIRLSMSLVVNGRTAGIPVTGKSRSACGDVAVTCSRAIRRNPKGVEPAVFQVKAKADWLVHRGRQIINNAPTNSLQGFVVRYWQAIRHREWRQDLARLIQNLDSQFALWVVHVDEKMLSTEAHWTRCQRASRFARVHRGEAVAPERGQARAQSARLVASGPTGSSANVEVKLVSHDEESAARGLDIVGVPVALFVGHGTERPPIRTRPMPSVPA